MRKKLTTRSLEALRNDAIRSQTDSFQWDTELKGFGAKASAHGALSWVVQKWQGGRGGKAQRAVIGHFPPMDLDEARKQAGIVIGDVSKGIDIVDRKAKARIAKRQALNAIKVGEAVDRYLARKSTPGSYWAEVRRKFEREIVPTLGADTILATLVKSEARALIEAKLDKGQRGSARYMFAVLRPFFKWCVEQDLIAASPLADVAAPDPLEARDRVLTNDEIRSFWKATQSDSLFGPFFRLLLLTAQRREEVAGMRREELDLKAAMWTIPKERTKNGKEHVVHLSPQALATIHALPKPDSDYVFTTTLDGPISGYGKAKARLDAAMGDPKPWRVHDLRRTAASGMASLGFQPHIIERVLNHTSGAQGGLVGVYQRYEFLAERKRAIEAWGNHAQRLAAEIN